MNTEHRVSSRIMSVPVLAADFRHVTNDQVYRGVRCRGVVLGIIEVSRVVCVTSYFWNDVRVQVEYYTAYQVPVCCSADVHHSFPTCNNRLY